MSILKCKMCGGTIEYESGSTVGECLHCGTKQTLPKLDDDRKANLYDRANHFRRNNDYDKAAGIFEQVLNEDPMDSEAYWSLVLCQYGIEYVEDPATHKRVPTVNRAQFTSIFDDDNYKSALQYADILQKSIYEQEANTINEIQKGILSISQKEDPFDVFICYKETDAYGRRTPDSVLANDLYHQLTLEGFKVFFSRITLEDKLGTAYEPYIFAALNSAKVMVVLGTKPEYFNAVWVKNEWSRYLGLVKNSNGKKILIPAYKDMDPYDLPEEFSHLQAQDMSKLGFMQDLIRGIKKILAINEPKPVVKEFVKEVVKETSSNASVESFLKRVDIFLEDAQWDDANTYCEKVLDIDPENARAYLGKLMAELHVRRHEDLKNCEKPFNSSNNYQKAVRFGDDKIVGILSDCIDHIKERNENVRLINVYNTAVTTMKSANSESSFKVAAATFKTIPGFKDADSLAEQCLERAEERRRVEEEQRRIEEEQRRIKEEQRRVTEDKAKCIGEAIKLRLMFEEELAKENNKLMTTVDDLTIKRANLSRERIGLGIFAVKEKKRLDEEMNHIQTKILDISSRIGKLKDRKSDISNQIRENVERRYKFNSKDVFSYEEAIKIYLKEPEVTRIVNTVFFSTISSDSVMFGRYIHEKNGTPIPIEWQVLKRENDRMLIISKYVLDYYPYNLVSESVTWEKSAMRQFLQHYFLREAFSDEERTMICSVTVSAERNPKYSTSPGNSTIDQVFLLSISEATDYLDSINARRCPGTEYCFSQGANKGYKINCGYWLRSPGAHEDCAAYVNSGCVDFVGKNVKDRFGVRPALWINLKY